MTQRSTDLVLKAGKIFFRLLLQFSIIQCISTHPHQNLTVSIMSANPIFLNCKVRKADGAPIVGVHVRSLCLSQPTTIFEGCTDFTGQIWSWAHHGTMDQQTYHLNCSQGSYWRILFDIPDHAFPGISADLHISGNTDAHANVTLTITPDTVTFSNGSMENISQYSSLLERTPGSIGPHFVGPRASSSLGSISDISSFALDDEGIPLLSDVRSIVSPLHSPRSARESETGDVSSDDWVETQTDMEEEDFKHCSTAHKRKHDESDLCGVSEMILVVQAWHSAPGENNAENLSLLLSWYTRQNMQRCFTKPVRLEKVCTVL